MSKETRNLILFLAATFIWTWAFYAPIALSGSSPYQMPWTILLIFGGAGPSVVGVVMALLTYDREGRRDYWRRCFSLRQIRPLWWAVIGLIFPAIYALSVAVDRALGGPLPGMAQLQSLMAQPLMWPLAAFLSFMSGPWSEEFGWRGYALDPILKRLGTVGGAAVLGVIWGVWHLPLFWMPATWHGQIGFGLTGFWTFMLFEVGLSLTMTWIYKSTDRSILSGMLLHFTSNFTGQLIAPLSRRVDVVCALVTLATGLAACLLLSRRTKVKKPQAAVRLSGT